MQTVEHHDFHKIGPYHAGHVEIVVAQLGEGRWRKWPELFPQLDSHVDHVAHLVGTRIGQNAAVSQCPRPEFHASLEPADDFALRERVGDRVLDVVKLMIRKLSDVVFERLGRLITAERGTRTLRQLPPRRSPPKGERS